MEASVTTERRKGERERRTMVTPTDLLRQWKENERRGPPDRRSPGGAGLDSAVVGDASATAGWSEFRKKPVVVEAFHVTREALLAYYCDGEGLPSGLKMGHARFHHERRQIYDWRGYVTTVHGQETRVEIDDWIVAEPVPGRFYPVKPDIFAATYEPASTPPHEQQNEPSSSPVRAPGDEPADAWEAHEIAEACEMAGMTTPLVARLSGALETIRARRAAPLSKENPE